MAVEQSRRKDARGAKLRVLKPQCSRLVNITPLPHDTLSFVVSSCEMKHDSNPFHRCIAIFRSRLLLIGKKSTRLCYPRRLSGSLAHVMHMTCQEGRKGDEGEEGGSEGGGAGDGGGKWAIG